MHAILHAPRSILLVGALAIAPTAASATEFMSKADLLATIPGRTISAKDNKGTPWTQVYSSGKTKGTIEGDYNGKAFTAKWFVKGDQWCEDWGDGKACWDVERVDETSLRMYENGKPKKNLWKLR